MPPGVILGLQSYYTRCKLLGMTLDQYLSLPGKTASQLATDAETSGATITRLLYGDAKPSADMIRAIVKATDGKVTADDLLFGAPRPKQERAA